MLSRITSAFCQLSLSLSFSLFLSLRLCLRVLSDSDSYFHRTQAIISFLGRLRRHSLSFGPSYTYRNILLHIFIPLALILTLSRLLSTINYTELTIFQFILISRSVLCSKFVDSHLPTRWTLHSLIGSSLVGSRALGAVNGAKTANPLR